MRPSLVFVPALLASLALLAVVPAAQGAYAIGIGDQKAAMFASPFFRALDVRVSRLIVSYDAVLSGTFEVADVDAWMRGARAAGVEPLIAFGHSRGCFDGEGIVNRKACRLPSVARYADAYEAFRDRYPDVDVYSPWNEINHRSQPTARNPKRAAEFYNLVRRRCRGCKVVAADILDQAGMTSYLRAFKRYARGTPRIWGLHNYKDTNDFTTAGTRRMLSLVKGQIWLTETGGIVKFGRNRPYNPARAARATRFMFRLADSSKRITRLYVYSWSGQERCQRFDAGLVTPGGRPRAAYRIVRSRISRQDLPPRPAPPPPTAGPEPALPPDSTPRCPR